MTELLAPAGNIEALKAAISNGCDAIYLGMNKFGARAYSDNFDIDSLREAIVYAHLRNVKIYVTMNTIIFEDEISDMKNLMHKLNEIGVDGIIVQDLAAFDYGVSNFEDMEIHCSTQMGIDDLDGTLLCKELGAKRVVLTGISYDEKRLGVACYDAQKKEYTYYPGERIESMFHGTGDVWASTFTGAYTKGIDFSKAAEIATDFTVECIKATMDDKENHWYGVKFELCLPLLWEKMK